MRVTPLGAILLTICTVFVLSSILFMKLSLMVSVIAILTVIAYARLRFLAELKQASYEVRRDVLDSMVFAGESAAVRVEVVNKTDRAMSASFEDLLPVDCGLREGSNKVEKEVAPASVFSFTYSFAAENRGVHAFEGFRVRRTDPFGLFEHEETSDHVSMVNVHTRRQSLDAARKTAGSEHLEYAGFARSPAVVLQEFEFDGLKDYDFGDRARDIHWKSSSRLGRLMTKVYRKEGALQTMVLVDCSSSMRLANGPVAKVDHAVDLAIQISNVLLSNLHPSGVALFDEVHVLDEASPALGRHQFEKIVTALRNVPGAVHTELAPETPAIPQKADNSWNGNHLDERSKAFITAVGTMTGARHPGGGARLGLEGEIARVAATKRSQQKLFVVLTDLTSCRDAVLAGARLCKRTNNRMLVINTYNDWYIRPEDVEELQRYEGMYSSLDESMAVEKALRKQGVSFLRIGPADTAQRIVRTIRRGLA